MINAYNLLTRITLMKKYLLILAVMFSLTAPVYSGDGCYICGSGSSDGIQQCQYKGSDTFDQRKKCEANGCKVSGTTSCSTAANVKVIKPN